MDFTNLFRLINEIDQYSEKEIQNFIEEWIAGEKDSEKETELLIEKMKLLIAVADEIKEKAFDTKLGLKLQNIEKTIQNKVTVKKYYTPEEIEKLGLMGGIKKRAIYDKIKQGLVDYGFLDPLNKTGFVMTMEQIEEAMKPIEGGIEVLFGYPFFRYYFTIEELRDQGFTAVQIRKMLKEQEQYGTTYSHEEWMNIKNGKYAPTEEEMEKTRKENFERIWNNLQNMKKNPWPLKRKKDGNDDNKNQDDLPPSI